MKIRLIGLIPLAVFMVSCVYHDIKVAVNCAINPITIHVSDTVNASVCGAEDGELTVSASGGKSPYTYSINNQPEQNTPVFTNLSSGFHTITVFDANRCNTAVDSVLVSVDQFEMNLVFGEDNECLTDNGTMDITVLEDNGPYQFKMDQGALTSSTYFENLSFGNHFLTVQDNDGCNFQRQVTVPRGQTSVSWANDILPIMTSSCAVPGCHNGISRSNDWRVYAQVKTNAATIKKKTQDRSMPFDRDLSDEQIALITCWVDDGALEN